MSDKTDEVREAVEESEDDEEGATDEAEPLLTLDQEGELGGED